MMTKVYHASLYDRTGYLARIDRALTFKDSLSGEITEIEPEMIAFLTVRGPLDAETARLALQQMRGCHDHLNCAMGS